MTEAMAVLREAERAMTVREIMGAIVRPGVTATCEGVDADLREAERRGNATCVKLAADWRDNKWRAP